MGHPPLANFEALRGIQERLEQQNIIKLEDVSSWDENGNWLSWLFPKAPNHLQNQQNMLKDELVDSAPIHKQGSDSWGWGNTGIYTVAIGFRYLQSQRETNQPTIF